ncbi:DUF922 domain-containing protein [Psychroserpens ponticola]|uniref:DUF922 domain-containing protein n=1 Tax=Psychroserpens ponticola TaxID=2932268 RepID=A0ABY7RZL5_9FLAO|nr:hypothetical protein [Psychroserpens ponticola]WCO02478.1 hypothetical protein MUN68_003055 [Psychroserpens ponticola]
MLTRFFLILALCLNSSAKNEDTISWNESNKLSWADFKGPKDTSSDAAAVTASGITFSYAVRKTDDRITGFDAEVFAHFYPESSWFIKDRCNDYILAHEQLHFDITELHVRIFRYRLAQLEASQNIKTKLNEVHKTVNKELSDMQHQYDSQSRNSINKEEQAKWTSYVAENLQKFAVYKSE